MSVRRFGSLRSSLGSSLRSSISNSSNENRQSHSGRPSIQSSQSSSQSSSQGQISKYTSAQSPVETLLPIEEERYDAYFDRTFDLLATVPPHEISIDQKTEVFQQLIDDYEKKNEQHIFPKFPADIRQKIYSFCFNDCASRKISLSPKFATRAIFPDDYFASPWNVLDPVWGGLRASRALRYDLMNYFWTSYHFHVTLNVFSGPVFSPLSHIWLLKFLDRIQRLTIESDFTRFGGSSLKIAPAFGHNNDKVEDLLLGLIKRLVERSGKLTMTELNLMCRRYAGCRPYTNGPTKSAVEYCPDNPIYIFDAMANLRGILQRCRVSGFMLEYTEQLLTAAFTDGDRKPEFIKPIDCAWPPMPPSSIPPSLAPPPSNITSNSGSNLQYTSPFPPFGLGIEYGDLSPDAIWTLSPASASPPGILGLHHSKSFAEEVEEGMKGYSILCDLPLTLERTGGWVNEQSGCDDTEATLKSSNQPPSGARASMFSNYSSQNQQTSSINWTNPYFSVRESMISDSSGPTGASTPRSQPVQQGGILCTRTFSISDGTRTPSPERCSTPKSPEALNELNERDPAFIRALNAMKSQSQIEANEQDPAFIRTVEAMRSNSQTPTSPITPIIGDYRPQSFMSTTTTTIESPAERSIPSATVPKNGSAGIIKRRYLSFMGRFRGRTN